MHNPVHHPKNSGALYNIRLSEVFHYLNHLRNGTPT
nr:MAG TPA: hypothetical protein [Caudoviricetes sp.]